MLLEHWIADQVRNDNFCVIPDRLFVIPDLIRDPVPRIDWIADQVRNDSKLPQ